VQFALVANRALAPGSKLAAASWVNRRAHVEGLPETSDDACYGAMDWLLDIAPDLGAATTEGGTAPADEGTAADGVGFRTYGKSKDSRDDLPQVVIGMAVTRPGSRYGCGAGPGTPLTPR